MENSVDILYRKVLQYIQAYYFDITKLLNYRSFTKYLYFKRNVLKKRITQYFLAENKSPCFLVKLSKQNLLQLNMSKI